MSKGTPSLDSERTRRRVKKVLREGRQKTESGCWEWTRARSRKGYGVWRINRKWYKVHRLSAWLWLGFDIHSEGLVLHRCDNPPCFNPKHLYIGNEVDNYRDSVERGGRRVELS